ncbi:cobalt transporter [Mycolicibacterium agri]|uniref:Cobalt transporter n=1 Tax=Mycolicibacterium agri TaxID=36811 RepID=A0A2A7NG34_MYCAG|nr:CbtB domain-containing protein [Mycolicibacterium agri]PEG43082.1 cobalt transporter [Mycolicibacterium agri]GFG54536.1 cobalt transporter [Mycolicibacterium agri]
MTSPEATSAKARKSAAPAVDISAVKAAVWLSATAFLALLVLYFVGLDQGATSVFGSNTYVHEFMHDARHLLGFPCH